MRKKKQEHYLEDATIAAFLTLQGHNFTPQKRSDGRIVFRTDDDISKDLEDLYANPQVGVLDYIRVLTQVREKLWP